MVKTQRLAILIIIALSLLGVYFIASPYVTTYQLKSAMENSDADRVLNLTDMDAIRENLQNDLLLVLEKKVPSTDNNPFAIIGREFATGSIKRMVDELATPEMVRKLMNQNALKSESNDLNNLKDATASYRNLNRFEISLESKDEHIILELRRGEVNVMNWKLVRIRVSDSYLENLM